MDLQEEDTTIYENLFVAKYSYTIKPIFAHNIAITTVTSLQGLNNYFSKLRNLSDVKKKIIQGEPLPVIIIRNSIVNDTHLYNIPLSQWNSLNIYMSSKYIYIGYGDLKLVFTYENTYNPYQRINADSPTLNFPEIPNGLLVKLNITSQGFLVTDFYDLNNPDQMYIRKDIFNLFANPDTFTTHCDGVYTNLPQEFVSDAGHIHTWINFFQNTNLLSFIIDSFAYDSSYSQIALYLKPFSDIYINQFFTTDLMKAFLYMVKSSLKNTFNQVAYYYVSKNTLDHNPIWTDYHLYHYLHHVKNSTSLNFTHHNDWAASFFLEDPKSTSSDFYKHNFTKTRLPYKLNFPQDMNTFFATCYLIVNLYRVFRDFKISSKLASDKVQVDSAPFIPNKYSLSNYMTIINSSGVG